MFTILLLQREGILQFIHRFCDAEEFLDMPGSTAGPVSILVGPPLRL